MDITKFSVIDPRIIQKKPVYAVEKGALSITNGTFQAIANSSSQQTFQVQVPSENVFVDRAVDWVNTVSALVTLAFTANTTVGQVLLQPGANFSLAPFPVHQSVQTLQGTINDQSVTVNMSDVLPQILRLSDLAKTRQQRTCPTMLDRYYQTQSTADAPNSPIGDFGSAYSSSEVGNGAWGDLKFYVPAGQEAIWEVNADGLPAALGTTKAFVVGVEWTTAEKLVLPPFIFADEDELSTGLFGVQNIQFTANFSPTPARSVRIARNPAWSTVPTVAWDTQTNPNGSPFKKALIQVQFLTPSLDVNLPSKSTVPWMEFPRYISPVVGALTAGSNTISSQTITLSSLPDLLLIYVKPQSYASPYDCDWSLPVQKISMNFDNISGMLSGHSQYELYKMSVFNGLEMDFNQWSGKAWVKDAAAYSGGSGQTALVGGPLVLRPGRDFALSTGMAPGLVGNFTLQYDVTVGNYTGGSPAVSIYTVAVNSGFFETMRGSSRILKGVVTEQDILGAPVAQVESSMERLVGEGKRSAARSKKPGMHMYTRS